MTNFLFRFQRRDEGILLISLLFYGNIEANNRDIFFSFPFSHAISSLLYTTCIPVPNSSIVRFEFPAARSELPLEGTAYGAWLMNGLLPL